MDQELLKFAISQGLFAALFVWLLIEENKKSATDREVRIFIKDIFNYYNSRCKYNSFIKTNINN